MTDETVVEFLTFRIPVAEQADWLAADARHWTRFLEQQPGFIRKERWRDRSDPELVSLVIWWRSHEAWKAVSEDGLTAVAGAMGASERTPECVAFDVINRSPDPLS